MMKNTTLNLRIFYVLCLMINAISHALTIDTTLVGKDSPGPYILSWHFINPSSIKVAYKSSPSQRTPEYVFIDKVNGILFSESIDSGLILSVQYETDFYGVQKTYSIHKKKIVNLIDTTSLQTQTLIKNRQSFSQENLSISGYKSVGISLGSQGQLNLQQALEVRIFGKINDNTELSANLSDQETSLQGDTREIGEIDNMFVTLTNPRYSVTVGDMFVTIPAGGLIEGQKKIKGISAAYTGHTLQTSFASAISGGKFTIQNIQGQLGFQGPYYLAGKGEADIITPIRGTIRILVNGKELHEGEHRDYVVNYDIASIRFNPTFPIKDNSLIQVYYEYKAFDYQRLFLSNTLSLQTSDTSLSVNGTIWFETDNKKHSIDITLDDTVITALKEAGDKVPLVTTGRLINEFDVPEQNTITRLYRVVVSNNKTSFYQYTPYNIKQPDSTKGFYHVWFSHVPQGSGGYKLYTPLDSALVAQSFLDSIVIINLGKDSLDTLVITILNNELIKTYSPIQRAVVYSFSPDSHLVDTVQFISQNETLKKGDTRGPTYVHIGEGKGNYTARAAASTPKRRISGELSAVIKPRDWLQASLTIAGEEEDHNLFSNIDDNDNTASASRSHILLGRKVYDEPCFWLQGSHRFSSYRFSREILSSFERRILWDRENFDTQNKELNIWQSSSGITMIPNISATLGYGQFISNRTLKSQRVSYGGRIASLDHFLATYSGIDIKHFDSLHTEKLHIDTIHALQNFKPLNIGLTIDDEWQVIRNGLNRGKIGLGINMILNPVSVSEFLYISQARKGGTSIFTPLETSSIDTGFTVIWEQNASHSPRSEWRYSGSSSYHFEKVKNPALKEKTKSVLLVTLSNDIASVKTGFSTNQNYRLSSEKASFFTPIFIPVDTLKGTHYYDLITGEYKPGFPYNWKLLDEQELFDTTGTDRIRKSLVMVNWFYKPYSSSRKGILSDLSWNGSLILEEHCNSSLTKSLRSWIPGYNSIFAKEDRSIVFADCSYRQDINYRPFGFKGFHLNLNFRPYVTKNRTYDESGYKLGGELEQDWNKWFLGLEGIGQTHHRSNRSSTDTTQIKDRSLTFSQRYYFITAFSIFCNETIGRAEKKLPFDPFLVGNTILSGPYFHVQPGLTLRLPGKGWAELSYSFSYVDIHGDIEYPMAQGFRSGTSHCIDVIIDINAGKHFTIGGSYRGDFTYNDHDDIEHTNKNEAKMLHIVSMEIKAFL